MTDDLLTFRSFGSKKCSILRGDTQRFTCRMSRQSAAKKTHLALVINLLTLVLTQAGSFAKWSFVPCLSCKCPMLIYLHTHVYTQTHTHAYIYINIYTVIYICSYIYIYIYIWSCAYCTSLHKFLGLTDNDYGPLREEKNNILQLAFGRAQRRRSIMSIHLRVYAQKAKTCCNRPLKWHPSKRSTAPGSMNPKV